MRRIHRFAVLILAAVPLLAAVPARAAGWGPRAGLTSDPDQVHVGVHADFGDVFAPRVRFQPNLEVGFGDHLTTTALNFEAAYRFAKNWDAWSPYAGGGLGLNWYSWNNDVVGRGDTSMQTGLNVLGGIEKGIGRGNRFFIELKLGLADSPDLKATVGWTFF